MTFMFKVHYHRPRDVGARLPNGWLRIERFTIERHPDNDGAMAGSKDATIERLHNYLTVYAHHYMKAAT